MKYYFVTALILLNIVCASAQNFNVATYNLRNENTYDVGNLWKDRKFYVAKLIQFHEFDIFGTQEALPGQLEDLKSLLPSYNYYGEGRDGNGQGEHTAIFYKTDRFKLLNKGDFWLSETPDIPSKSWDAPCCNRICTWIELQDLKTKKKFFVFNAHYDYEKDFARAQSSLLVLLKIQEIVKDKPVIFMGDLNGGLDAPWVRLLCEMGNLRNSYYDTNEPYANNASFNAFGKLSTLGNDDKALVDEKRIIDHIFFSKHFKTLKWGMLTDTYDMGKFPSDHFPIVVKTVISKK